MNATPQNLRDIPLWRLIVALADAESTAGPDSASARVLARAVQAKLRGETHRPAKEGGKPCPT